MKIHLIESAEIFNTNDAWVLKISSNKLIEESEFLEIINPNLSYYHKLYEIIIGLAVRDQKSPNLVIATKETPIRLGVGSLHVEGDWVLLVKRDNKAPRMPNAYDIAAGIFDSTWNNPVEAIFGESAEILRSAGGKVFYLRHKSIRHSESRIVDEYRKISQLLIGKRKLYPIDVKFQQISNPIHLEYNRRLYTYPGTITFEPTNGSLEYIVLLDIPQDNYSYWDGELLKDKIPLNREIHKINIVTGIVEIWRKGKKIKTTNIEAILNSNPKFTSKAAIALYKLFEIRKSDVLFRLCQYTGFL